MQAPKRPRKRQPAGLGAARALFACSLRPRTRRASTRSSRRITRTIRPRPSFSGWRAAPASTGSPPCAEEESLDGVALARPLLRCSTRGASRHRGGRADCRPSKIRATRSSLRSRARSRSSAGACRDRADPKRLGGNRGAARPRRDGARPLCRAFPQGALSRPIRSASSAARRRRSRSSRRKSRCGRSRVILKAVGGADYTPPLAGGRIAPRRAFSQTDARASSKRTLSGVVVSLADDRLTARREWGRNGLADATAPAGATLLWDGRFEVEVPRAHRARSSIGALGRSERRLQVAEAVQGDAVQALPGLYQDGTLVAVPPAVSPADQGRAARHFDGRMYCRPTTWSSPVKMAASRDDHHFGGFRLHEDRSAAFFLA